MKSDSLSRFLTGISKLGNCPQSKLLIVGALLFLASPAIAQFRTWTGNVSAYWSDPNNWDPVGVPQNGDGLNFGSGSNSSMVNDLVGLVLSDLSFAEEDHVLSGNELTITRTYDSIYNGYDFVVGNPSFTTTINCPLLFPNGGVISTHAGAGAFTESTADMYLNGQITIGSTNQLSFDARAQDIGAGGNGHFHIASVISGTGDVYASAEDAGGHVSTISFDGPGNVFSGSLLVETTGAAQITFNKSSGAMATNRLLVTEGRKANVYLAQPNQLGNNTVIEIDGGSQLLLSGNNVGVGSLIFTNFHADASPSTLDSGSALVGIANGIIALVDNDHVHPTIKGRLNLIGYEQFNIIGGPEPGLEIQAAVGGNGFQKFGAGTLQLTGNNTYSGDVEAIEGTIEAYTSTAFGETGPTYGVHLEGGNITLQNATIGNELLFVNSSSSLFTAIGQCSWMGPVNLATSLNVVPLDPTFSNHTMDFSGPIDGPGGLNLLPAIFGVGSVRLVGLTGNTYTGPTVVGCSLLQLGKPSGINAYAGPLVVGNPGGTALCEARWLNSYQNVRATATLYANGLINLNNQNEDFGSVTFNGGTVDSGPSGNFVIYAPLTVNPSPASAMINGNLGLAPGADRVFIVGDGASDCDLLVNAVIYGSPGTYFVKQGPGTMCLTSANTFNAPTLLEQGILDINIDLGLGTWPGLIIFDGATLRISGPGNTSGGVELLGTGVGGTHGAIEVLPGNSFGISGSVLLDASTTLNIGSGGALGLSGAVSGAGPLIKTGTGGLVFGGGANNIYSGDTVVSAGSLLLARSANRISVPGNLIIGPGPAGPTTFARLFQSGGMGGISVTVNANSLFDINGYYQALTTLNLRDGGSVQTGVALLDFPSGGAINVGTLNAFTSHPGSTITGAIGLPANTTLSFNVSPITHFFPFANGPDLDVQAAIPRPVENLGFAPAGITKNGLGWMRLGGNNTYAGLTAVNDGKLDVDGTQPLSSVAVNSGTLGGSGTVGPLYMTGSSAVVAPGDNGPGILTCSNLNAGISASGALRIELNGTTAGTGYDQLNVRGTVNLAGVELQRSLGFAPPTGAQFDIISNDGRDAVAGTFNGLPDGGKLYIGGVLYQINYEFNGRPGNDVALQGLDTPPPPTLMIQRLSTNTVGLIWATNDPPFSLQTTTNLPATNWIAALPLPVVIGTNSVVTNPVEPTPRFYRLSNP